MYMNGRNQVHLYVFCNFCGNRKDVRITQSNTFNKKSKCSEDSHSKYRRINIKIKCWREKRKEKKSCFDMLHWFHVQLHDSFLFFSPSQCTECPDVFPLPIVLPPLPWCCLPFHCPPPPLPNFVALFQCASSYTISTCPLCLHPSDHASSENTGWASRIYCHICLEHTVHMNCYPDIYLKNVILINGYCDIHLESTMNCYPDIYLENIILLNCYPDVYLKNVRINCYCDICLENTIHIFW